ncbi:hypothetical protein GQ53DRAFT_803361 [Thozetella sp. PMI_491]|nr:hypothetical protein GQ53DRAFT_803361 [Thozetella sp. PMI_491]
MGSKMLSDPDVRAVFVMCVVTIPLAIVAPLLRFISARRLGRTQSAEDWCAYGAVAVHLAYVSTTIHGVAFLDGRGIFELTLDDILYIGKIYYAVPPLFVLNQVLSKLSICLLYHRVFGVIPHFNRWIYIVDALTVAWGCAALPVFLFSCTPISRGWNLLEAGTCVDYPTSVAGVESVNSAIDFGLVVLAWFMLQPLTSLATRVKLGVIFAIGGLAGIVGIVKIAETYTFVGVVNYMTGLWAIVQMACSIICCCAPTYKPILPRGEFFSRLSESFSRLISSRRRGSSDTSEKLPY